MILVVSGVSGSGKTTIGKRLVERCGGGFFDADDYHSAENIAKMRSGQPLGDDDREDWLQSLVELLQARVAVVENTVLACSALKKSYRERLVSAAPDQIKFAILTGDKELIATRIRARDNHFMPSELLDSQFEAFEPSEKFPEFDVAENLEQIVSKILSTYPKLCA